MTAVSSTQVISNTLWCLDGLIPADKIQFYRDSNDAHRHSSNGQIQRNPQQGADIDEDTEELEDCGQGSKDAEMSVVTR